MTTQFQAFAFHGVPSVACASPQGYGSAIGGIASVNSIMEDTWYWPQANRVIAGTTQDSGGVALPNVPVICFDSATNTVFATSVSDGSGNYSFTVDPFKSYYVVAQTATLAGVTLETLVGA